MNDLVVIIGIGWLGLAVGVLLGHLLWPRPRVVERRRRHGTVADRRPEPVRHLPPPPPGPTRVRRADSEVPPTAQIPAQGRATLSERGEPMCHCPHDLLDHSKERPQPCFACTCPAFRPVPRPPAGWP